MCERENEWREKYKKAVERALIVLSVLFAVLLQLSIFSFIFLCLFFAVSYYSTFFLPNAPQSKVSNLVGSLFAHLLYSAGDNDSESLKRV